MDDRTNIGDAVKNQRAYLGLTQQSLSQRAHISLATLQNIEAGRGNPSWETLTALFRELGLTISIEATGSALANLVPLGLPLLDSTTTEFKKMNYSRFVRHVNRLVSELQNVPAHSREEQAVTAYLWALQDHYPSVWHKLNPAYADWLKSHSLKNRSIKLRRLSLANLSEIL